jgi:SpoVK/Ycf46/Vps4 family AAA+-type ATPase
MKNAQSWAGIILQAEKAKKDEYFCKDMLRKLDVKRSMIELPKNLQGLLVAEDSSLFPVGKYFVRSADQAVADEILKLYKAAERLSSMGIPYLPAAIFHGESGCGKTELVRYIAHKAELPFVYVQFSNLVGYKLGSTQSNIGQIFAYVRENPCVLCFDEIDAIGMRRGMNNDVGEMNRIVIALMQELDQLPNNLIIIGTTNRFDGLDPALARRFPIQYEIQPLSSVEAYDTAHKIFEYAGVGERISGEWYRNLDNYTSLKKIPASSVVKMCTDAIVALVMEDLL